MARIAKFLSFSNVVACLALFVALGGSVYAAGKISGKQIKPSSLPGNRIKPKTIAANRVKPKSLTGRQVKSNSLTGEQIDEKTLTVSAAALADVQYESTTLELSGKTTAVTANCPAGSYAIGGGATLSSSGPGDVRESGPSPLRTGWTASGYSWESGVTMTVTAICVAVEKPGSKVTSGGAAPKPPEYFPGS